MNDNVHPSKFERIKKHVKRNKKKYVVGGSLIVVAGVAYYIGYRSGSVRILSPYIVGDNNKLDQRVITLAGRQGPPSWEILWVEQNMELPSQRAASLATGLSESHISKQLNGKRPPVGGVTLLRLGLAA